MKKRKKILVFGYFGYVTNQLDGQTVKTRAIYELLKDYSECEVRYADTQAFRSSKNSIFKFLKDLFTCDKLVILPCLNNLKFLFPPIYLISQILRFDIIHIGIGGWHKEYLSKWPVVRSMLKRIKINLFENTLTCKELNESFGFNNIGVIPNFRKGTYTKPIKGAHNNLKLVFMARINIKKGLDTLSELSERIKKSDLNTSIILDLYGPFDSEEDRTYLNDNLVNKYTFVKYKGHLEPHKITSTLSEYDIMLFPTHYYTEGFPGSVLDAFRAGLPVIATNWKHARQFIHNDKDGFIVDFNNPVPEIFAKLNLIQKDRTKLIQMQDTAFEECRKYLPSEAWRILKPYIENNNA